MQLDFYHCPETANERCITINHVGKCVGMIWGCKMEIKIIFIINMTPRLTPKLKVNFTYFYNNL
jgi:hypothetical protein